MRLSGKPISPKTPMTGASAVRGIDERNECVALILRLTFIFERMLGICFGNGFRLLFLENTDISSESL